MREIKFRAWDVEGKRMFYPRKMEYTPGGGWWILSENTFVKKSPKNITGFKKKVEFFEPLNGSNSESAPIMQYTGLLDKNGKEIYEGDVVRGAFCDGVIKFNEELQFVVDPAPSERFENPLFNEHHAVAVIGNIHEHPSLLEAK